MKLLYLFVAAFNLISPSIISAFESWTHCTVLDRDGKYHICWTPTDDSITFKVEVKTKGYVGLGLSPHGAMTGGDIVIGWVVPGGQPILQDRHGVGNTFPPMDDSQDWELISGSENDTHTKLTFRRKLQTCDPQDMEIDGSTIRLIYSYNDNDPETPGAPKYHGKNRGVRSIMLLQPHVRSDQNLEEMAYWDVKSPNYTLTSQYSSMYWCKIHRAPELKKKHHIVRIEPLLQPNNERYVHHLVLYECVGGIPADLEPYVDQYGHECYSENMPPAMLACEGVFAAWGVGGEPMVFPGHVGLPLEAQPPKYYMLEIHYDNPSYHHVQDESGFRIYYTPKLRQYDAGTFMIGAAVTPRVFIPPLQKQYTVVGHSSYECIGSEMPDDGVKMLGVFLHAHLLGRQLKARHFRENIELLPLADDRHYDFNYQEYHYFDKEVTMLPDDQITVECVYDSSERDRITFGGLSTKDEMCLAFILYYPRIERFGCLSVPTLPLVSGLVGAVVPSYKDDNVPSELPTLTGLISHIYKNFDWDAVNISLMENALRYSPHQTYCYIGTGSKGNMQQLVSYPKNLVPYEKPSKCPSQPNKRVESVENIPKQKNSGSRVGYITPLIGLSFAVAAGF